MKVTILGDAKQPIILIEDDDPEQPARAYTAPELIYDLNALSDDLTEIPEIAEINKYALWTAIATLEKVFEAALLRLPESK